MTIESKMVDDPGRSVRLEVLVRGEGPDVVLVPSAMRGAEDFDLLQEALERAGFRSLAIQPRGAGRSEGAVDGLTLHDLAEDISLVANRLCKGPAHLVGHALGNIFVRATASLRADVTRSVAVMPAGGHNLSTNRVAPGVYEAVGRCHDHNLSEVERLEALRIAFFAPGNDPAVWLDGWWPASGGLASAIGRSDPEEWWRGGEAPMLVIQPMNDAMAAPEVGRAVKAALGARVRYVEVDKCGHAILPEQPEAVARAVIDFLRELGE